MASLIWHSMAVGPVLKEIDTDPHQGLSEEEARRRVERYGPNELRKEERASPFALFLHQFKNTLIVILLVATVLSALVGEIVDAGIILAIVVFSTVLGFVQEHRAERALEALKKMLTPTITAIRGGAEQEIPSRDLVPADVPVGDRRNMVFTGTTVTYGRGKAVVTATGMKTEFGKIAEEVAAVEEKETPLERRTAEIGRWLGIIALSVCFLVAGISVAKQLIGGKITLEFTLTMVMFAVALAVAAVPEALAALLTGGRA